jgi:hypothetical protein
MLAIKCLMPLEEMDPIQALSRSAIKFHVSINGDIDSSEDEIPLIFFRQFDKASFSVEPFPCSFFFKPTPS